jgi:excisionase family DNA binding protein
MTSDGHSADHLARGESVQIILSGDESDTSYTLPETTAKLLVKVLAEIARGNAVAIVPIRTELSIREAVEWLNVSEPHLTRLMEQGRLPFHQVGTLRRIRLGMCCPRFIFPMLQLIERLLRQINSILWLPCSCGIWYESSDYEICLAIVDYI